MRKEYKNRLAEVQKLNYTKVRSKEEQLRIKTLGPSYMNKA